MQTSRRVLPPGIDDDVVFGILWIKTASLKTNKVLNTPPVKVQFWGQVTSAVLSPLSPQEYQIKCPITLFAKYLLDMRQNLKIEVEGLGTVPLDLCSRLKPNIGITTKSPFDHLQGFFPVMDSKNKKVASLQLQLCCTFNPDIAVRELAEDQPPQPEPVQSRESRQPKQQKREKEAQPLQRQIKGGKQEMNSKLGCGVCGCQADCRCPVLKVNSLDVLAVQKPQLFCQFYEQSRRKSSAGQKPTVASVQDRRIPNSLNLEPNEGVFEPKKYEPVSTPPGKSFPTVQKVLTYSNLRLQKQKREIEQLKQQLSQQEIPVIAIKQDPSSKGKLEPERKQEREAKQEKEKERVEQQEEKERETKQEGEKRASGIEVKQIKSISRLQKEKGPSPLPLKPQPQISLERGQLPREEVSLSQMSQVRKVNDSVSMEARQQILSRVVHLDQQLHKQFNVHPPLREVKPLPNVPAGRAPPALLKKPKRAVKSSGLLLNMVLEIDRSKVCLPASRFWLRFRPYGEKEFVKMGPDFEPTITLLFPVAEPQVLKMNKIPFLLEFWAGEQQFLGLARLSLQKVYQGFVLEGRLNEVAVKTSLLPTVVHKGTLPVTDLSDKVIGQSSMSVYIGTTGQLQAHLAVSKPLFPHSPSPVLQQQKPVSIPRQQQRAGRGSGSLESLSSLLWEVLSRSDASRLVLSYLSGRQAMDEFEFESLLDRVDFKAGSPYELIKTGNMVKCSELMLCLQDCQRVMSHLQWRMAQELQAVPPSAIDSIVGQIEKKNRLNLTQAATLQQIPQIGTYLPLLPLLLPDITPSPTLIQWLQGAKNSPPLPLGTVRSSAAMQAVAALFLKEGHLGQVQSMLEEADGQGSVAFERFRELVRRGEARYSTWWWLVLLTEVYEDSGDSYHFEDRKVNVVLVYNWLAKSSKLAEEKEDNQLIQKEKEQSLRIEQPADRSKEEGQEEGHGSPSLIQPQPTATLRPSPQHQPTLQPQQKKNQSIMNKPLEQLPQKTEQHTFTIVLEQLQLSQVHSGPAHLHYRFPLQDEQIPHPPINLMQDKHTYVLSGQSSHSLTLNSPILQHLADHPLVITLTNNGNTLQGHLHPAELIQPGSKTCVVPLFHPQMAGIQGKVKLTLHYSASQTDSGAIGRQTTQDLFLPKTGLLHYCISAEVDPSRLRQTLALPPEDSYLQLTLDVFGSSPQLAPHFPPVKSQLTLPLSPLRIEGSLPVTLSPNVLQHFRSGSWSLSISAVYYSKQGGNYQCRQAVLGTSTAPLLSAIKPSGLVGDYALKNRLGMFLALAHVDVSYRKKSGNEARSRQLKPSTSESTWLVLHFLELLNYEQELNWLKLELLHKGKRAGTERQSLKGFGAFPINGRPIVLQWDAQQLATTKILPVRMTTGQQQYALDLNLRPLAQHHSKVYAQSSYLLAVDSQARPTRIRVAVKVIALRGSHTLSPLVEGLANNHSPASHPQPKDYPSRVELLRKQLRMPSGLFEECLSSLLPNPKEELPPQLFSNEIWASLDLTPISSGEQSGVEEMAAALPAVATEEEVLCYLKERQLRLANFRPQFLERYSFGRLNSSKIDQNIEYLGLNAQIDVAVLARKIRIEEQPEAADDDLEERAAEGVLLTVVRGQDFHLLYNGITPNPLLVFPTAHTQSEPQSRTQHPLFNLTLAFKQAPPSLPVQVFHSPGYPNPDILIGEGILSIRGCLGRSQLHQATIQSVMSSRMQGAIDFKVEPLGRDRQKMEFANSGDAQQEDSVSDEAIESALARLKEDKRPRAALFESSDEEY